STRQRGSASRPLPFGGFGPHRYLRAEPWPTPGGGARPCLAMFSILFREWSSLVSRFKRSSELPQNEELNHGSLCGAWLRGRTDEDRPLFTIVGKVQDEVLPPRRRSIGSAPPFVIDHNCATRVEPLHRPAPKFEPAH